MRFQLLRAKYALLPHAGYAHEGALSSFPKGNVDAVLILHPLVENANSSLPNSIRAGDAWFLPTPGFTGGVLYLQAAEMENV